MRVLHVTPSHARRDGGPSETLRGLIPELIKHGVDVELLSTDKGLAPDDHDLEEVCEVTVVKSRPPRGWNFAPGMARKLWRLLDRIDLVHIHSINTFTTSITMVLCRLKSVPYIVEPHGALDSYHLRQGFKKKNFYNKYIDAWGYRGLSGVVYSTVREQEQGRLTLPAPAILMPLGIDESLFELDRNTPGTTPRVLHLGRIAHKKRVDLLLRAVASSPLAELDVKVIIAGPEDDDLEYDPQGLARELGILSKVEFVGRVDSAQRRVLLQQADVFVLASEDESFGMSVAEALAAGCATVASPEVGIAVDAAKDGALILTELDAMDIASKVQKALTMQPELSSRARTHARSKYRWSIASDTIARTYESILVRQ